MPIASVLLVVGSWLIAAPGMCTAPANWVAADMPIDREVLEAVREMDEPDLRRLFMLTRARLEHRGHSFPDLGPDIKIRQQMVKCGKDSCTTCPHGPYVYAYWSEDGRQKSKYLGRYDDVPEAEESEEGLDT